MASDDTTTDTSDTNDAAFRFLLAKATDHDLVEAFETTEGRGSVADLIADEMRRRSLDF